MYVEDLLQRDEVSTDEASELSVVGQSILATVTAMCNLGVLHTDLRLKNLVVMEDMSVRIIDFEDKTTVYLDTISTKMDTYVFGHNFIKL